MPALVEPMCWYGSSGWSRSCAPVEDHAELRPALAVAQQGEPPLRRQVQHVDQTAVGERLALAGRRVDEQAVAGTSSTPVGAMVTTTWRPCRANGPSSAWWASSPAILRRPLPSGRTTHTSVRTPPLDATAQASHSPSADQCTATTGSWVIGTFTAGEASRRCPRRRRPGPPAPGPSAAPTPRVRRRGR